MKRGLVQEAERIAFNELDKWKDITGFISKHTGYYYEIQGLIQDAVHIGIQMALNEKVEFDEYGNIKINK